MTSQTSRRHPVRALVAALATLLIASGGVLLGTAPAFAHDELVSSDPASGSTVDALPAALTLTFSGDLLSDASTTVVQVTDASGASLTDGAPTVSANVVTQPLTGSASGAVSVAWRVVSSDGHPIAGEFAFTSNAAPTPTPTPSETSDATPESAATPEPVVTTLVETVPSPGQSAPVWPWVVGAIVVLIAIGLVVWLLGARARQQKQAASERTAGRSNSTER
ncbi:copper resistance CopC family protein [Microbacterium sp. Clip185]|uniref:copper resistance CopC family protein n=1 Tax=Microbacterium sp. Clip185 TaxID=3025663 RepID=UPI002365355D|nr:copper resistance CopC family protein [Microbacterium sp. Clip185]WDG19314.1 copper resistance protein CopC [Microbacterium sp. Clip185]